MSHGGKGCILGVDGEPVSINDDVITPLDGHNWPAMKGNPKVIMIQACRGHRKCYLICLSIQHCVANIIWRSLLIPNQVVALYSRDLMYLCGSLVNFTVFHSMKHTFKLSTSYPKCYVCLNTLYHIASYRTSHNTLKCNNCGIIPPSRLEQKN